MTWFERQEEQLAQHMDSSEERIHHLNPVVDSMNKSLRNIGHFKITQYQTMRLPNQGDSGSAVVNSQGYIVGFVFAHVEIAALKIIIDPKGHVPDIPKIKERRQADGSVDVEGLVSANFVGKKFILVESAEMVMERWNKPGMELVMNY